MSDYSVNVSPTLIDPDGSSSIHGGKKTFGSSRPCSYNDLTDKPFGEQQTGSDTLIWDGNVEGRVTVTDAYGTYVKISDKVLTETDLAAGWSILYSDGLLVKIPPEDVNDDILYTYGGVLIINNASIIVIPTDNHLLDGTLFPKKGVYAAICDDGGLTPVLRLTIPGYTGFPYIKKIEEKYLPEDLVIRSTATERLNSSTGTITTEDFVLESGDVTNVITKMRDGQSLRVRHTHITSIGETVEYAQPYILDVCSNSDGGVTVRGLYMSVTSTLMYETIIIDSEGKFIDFFTIGVK